jgi:hypothetical protein
VPAITPASRRLFIDLQMLSDVAVTAPLEGFPGYLSSFDQSLGTRGTVDYLLQKFLLQGADLKRFCLRRGHERCLLHFGLL